MLEKILKILLLCLFITISTSKIDRSMKKFNIFDYEIISERTFEIDRSSNSFLKDGVPFRYISGSIHYFRVHPDDWRDRFQKLIHAGFNAVETYIEWASHEPEPGEYNFNGFNDIFTFLEVASEEGLLVILRPGPYIDAERDMGGLPYWLLREHPNINLRTMDSDYLYYVDRWYNVLYPLLEPYLYVNGGPVIMIQIENEFGSYPSCDFAYTSHLKDLTKELLGDQVVLFTTDGSATSYLKCGKVADVYATIDFGPGADVTEVFHSQRIFEPEGPLINSEYYPGWLDHWGDPHSTRTSEDVAETLDQMLALNASVNVYVFNGGTSFGMTAGSNLGSRFQSCPTSYDYDAPLTEAGDLTEKYYAIRNVTQKYVTLPPGPVPGSSEKYAYGNVDVWYDTNVLALTEVLDSVINNDPLTFEQLSVFNGIVIYSTVINNRIPDPAKLSIPGIHDRGYVFVGNDEASYLAGIISREQELYDLSISALPGYTLTIVAESLGRICYGDQINDFKGITSDVTINGNKLTNWTMYAIPLLNTTKLKDSIELLHQKTLGRRQSTLGKYRSTFAQPLVPPNTNFKGMTFYNGNFDVPADHNQTYDTFLRLDNWGKGYVWINDFLLGRYWPVVGPQVTLYVPRSLLQLQNNNIRILELEHAPCDSQTSCFVSFVDVPEIDGPTPDLK